jgi:phage regulator Rha-like protein
VKKQMQAEVSLEVLQSKIYSIRGLKVMLDKDLAELYGVKVKRLNEAVKRNIARFPSDFMFQLEPEENNDASSRSQFATLKRGQNVKYQPFAFTEQGIAMLSSVLSSERAIQVNIYIMRMFSKLRHMITTSEYMHRKLEELEKNQDALARDVNDILNFLFKEEESGERMGFRTEELA